MSCQFSGKLHEFNIFLSYFPFNVITALCKMWIFQKLVSIHAVVFVSWAPAPLLSGFLLPSCLLRHVSIRQCS